MTACEAVARVQNGRDLREEQGEGGKEDDSWCCLGGDGRKGAGLTVVNKSTYLGRRRGDAWDEEAFSTSRGGRNRRCCGLPGACSEPLSGL